MIEAIRTKDVARAHTRHFRDSFMEDMRESHTASVSPSPMTAAA